MQNEDKSLENDDNLNQDQEQLNDRPQDEIEDGYRKIPISDFENMKKQLKNANAESKSRREELAKYKEFGITPDDLDELIALRDSKSDTPENDDRIDRKELDKQRKSLEQKYSTDLADKDRQLAEMQQRLEATVIDAAFTNEIVRQEGVPELVLSAAKKGAKLVPNDNGGYDVRIVDENGDVEFNDKAEYMTIADRVAALKTHDTFGMAFKAHIKQGGGLQSQQNNRKPQHKVTKSELRANPKMKRDFIAKNCKGGDMSAYHNLAD